MKTVRATVKEFWAFVEEGSSPNNHNSPCWEWNGPHAYKGYMSFRSVLAHRAAATIYCGKIPAEVRQRCGNKKCVRLDHFSITMSVDEQEPKYLPVHKQSTVIELILKARGNTRYTIAGIKDATGFKEITIKKVLRESPLYDLLADIAYMKEHGISVQMQPSKKVLACA